jgi:predicted dinucleotide-binding enzyme
MPLQDGLGDRCLAGVATHGGLTMKIEKIGIVGSGNIGGNLGILLAKAGYQIFFSSRHPDTLQDVVAEAGANARAGQVADAIAFGDLVVLSVPMKALTELDQQTKQALRGKIVIDTSNPYPERDGAIANEARLEPGGMGVFVSRLLPGVRLIRGFNSVHFEDLKKTKNRNGETIGIPLAGDDPEALEVAVDLVRRIGLDPVVVGGLNKSRLFDVGSPVYATSAPAREIKKQLQL